MTPLEPVRARELLVAARLADALVYVAGVSGIVAGALLYRDGAIAFALVAWVLTFVAGAVLRLAAWVARGIAEVLVRTDRLGEELRELRVDRVAAERRGDGPPPGAWGGWHR